MSDPILLWNHVALEADRASHTDLLGDQRGPTRSSRALGIVHLAMYDAYAGVRKNPPNLPPYLPGLTSPDPCSSADAAVAAAAHATLSHLYPKQTAVFNALLAGEGDPTNPGHDFGLTVAEAIRADRAADPGHDAGGYTPSQARGKHRPDPDNPGQVALAPFYGARSKGFAITERHELAPPPFDPDRDPDADVNATYRRALREVRGLGIAPELMGTLPGNITARNVNQTLIGIFWAYDGAVGLGSPPRLYNQIVRRVAESAENKQPNTTDENARLFALVNVAMADAGILAWDQKYFHELWRPVVGIREHDRCMGPEAPRAANSISDDCDSAWLPLGAPNTNAAPMKNVTPNFPAYPSGHATFGAAALHMTRLFYGVTNRRPDKLFDDLDFISEELNGVSQDNKGTVRPRHVRRFRDGLWGMIEENGRSRVYLGVHWIFDAFAVKGNGEPDLDEKEDGKFIGGVPLGLQIAEDIFNGGRAEGLKKSTVGPRT